MTDADIEARKRTLPEIIRDGVATRHHPSIPPIERAAGKLRQIARWEGEMPSTGHRNPNGTEPSFATLFGSNGERDFMRALAQSAVEDLAEAEVAKAVPFKAASDLTEAERREALEPILGELEVRAAEADVIDVESAIVRILIDDARGATRLGDGLRHRGLRVDFAPPWADALASLDSFRLQADDFLAEALCADHYGPTFWRTLTDEGRAMYRKRFSDAIHRAADARREAYPDAALPQAEGWAILDRGEINVRSVCPTPVGAIVNWLLTEAGLAVSDGTPDKEIEQTFAEFRLSEDWVARKPTLVRIRMVRADG